MSDENTGGTADEVVVMRAGPASDTSKILAAVGYIFVPVAIIAALIDPYKDEDFVRFHSYQAMASWLVVFVAQLIPIVGWVLAIVVFVFEIIALIKALQSQYYEIPVIYNAVKGFIGV
jgi:uncharacterized membrane protein